ncbi:unnamed protein product, partial [Ixodes hexagonus]
MGSDIKIDRMPKCNIPIKSWKEKEVPARTSMLVGGISSLPTALLARSVLLRLSLNSSARGAPISMAADAESKLTTAKVP